MSADAITLADLQSTDWELKLDTPKQPGSGFGKVVQGLDDVSQCLLIICTTPQGSDPLRPTFGADLFSYIDLPIPQATAALITALTTAITQWEPRITLDSISTRLAPADAQYGAHLIVQISWSLKINALEGQTTVSLPYGEDRWEDRQYRWHQRQAHRRCRRRISCRTRMVSIPI